MKIKFLKEYKFLRGFENDVKFTTTQIFKDAIIDTVEDEVPDEDVQWLIDNGFAEKVDEQWLHDGASYYSPEVSGLAKKFAPSYNEYRGDDVHDEARRHIGICYKSREACQRFIDFLTAVEVVSHDEGFMKISRRIGYATYGYAISHNDCNKNLVVDGLDSTNHAGQFYFDIYKHAKASLDKHPNEWRTILDYDWSKGEDDNEN